MEKNIRDDFIGIFDNVFSDSLLDNFIDYYHKMEEYGIVTNRQDLDRGLKHQVSDNAFEVFTSPFWHKDIDCSYIARDFISQMWQECYIPYSNHFSILQEFGMHRIFDCKLQKTSPGEGYHIWHCEHMMKGSRDRILAWMIYLNDVEEGGETEFLYQKTRIKPKKNRLLIWPSQFTHTHRGNPPLSGDKYILTGWIELGVDSIHS